MTNNIIVRALIQENGKTFLVRRNEEIGYNQWQLPGGHTDGQPHKVAMKRELKEETNLDAGNLKPLGNFYNEVSKKKTFVFKTKLKKPFKMSDVKLQQEEINDYGWFTPKQYKKLNLTSGSKQILR